MPPLQASGPATLQASGPATLGAFGPATLGAFGPAGRPAVTSPAGTLSYARLRARIGARARDMRPGTRVAVGDPDPVETLTGVLAAQLAGATAVVVDPAWPGSQVRTALRLAGAGEVIDGGGSDAEALCWVGFTSGSAGTPRPIGRTAASWATSFPVVSQLTGIQAGQRVLVPGPLASSLFLFGALHALWAGAEVLLPGSSSLSRLPPAGAAHCVPAMLADLLTAAVPARLVVCSGAAVPDGLRERAASRGVTVYEYYGATELSFVAWRGADGRLRPFPGVEVRVRDGQIWARSGYLSRGYTGPVTGPLRWDGDGFATVGDLGAVDDEGGLVVLGRADGAILSGGATVLPEDVEAVLRTVAGVRDVVVVGVGHARIGAVVAAVVEAERGAEVRLSDLRRVARAGLSAQQRPRLWYQVDRLPRTGSGKPARATIAAGLADGHLTVGRLR